MYLSISGVSEPFISPLPVSLEYILATIFFSSLGLAGTLSSAFEPVNVMFDSN